MGQKKSTADAIVAHYKSVPGELFLSLLTGLVLKITIKVWTFLHKIKLGIKIMKGSKINGVPSLDNVIVIVVGYIYVF